MIHISPIITRNFPKEVFKDFLRPYKLCSQFVNSGKEIHHFLQEQLNENNIPVQELEEFLYKELLYGSQREIYVYNIFSFNDSLQNPTKLVDMIKANYKYIEQLNFNKILYQPVDDEIEDLVAIRVIMALDGYNIKKINMIFSVKCEIFDSISSRHSEYSYITVDLDFNYKTLYLKLKPKSKIGNENNVPSQLLELYSEKVKKMFNIQYQEFCGLHRHTLCNMNIDLYKQVYQKMVQSQPGLDNYIQQISKDIINKLNIDDYENKVADNNVFNIEDIIRKTMEHAQISDILYEKNVGDLEDVNGYVNYIKFSDGTNISARIRSENQITPIFASEAFMALRSSINNAQKISILKIFWLNNFFGLRVSYEAIDNTYLKIRLYKNHTKEEFEYAIKKYRECEERTITENPGIFRLEA